MSAGSGVGLIRVGNNGGKVILAYSGTPTAPYQGPAAMQEAWGLKNYTFQVTDAGGGSFSATIQLQGTTDAATAAGTASQWFTIGQLTADNSFITFLGAMKAVRANVTAYASGSLIVEATAVS